MAERATGGPGDVRYVAVADGGGPAEGRCLPVVVEGRGVVIFRTGGRLLAVSDRCPHNGMPLHDGALADGVITCRWHGWSFDLTSGYPPGVDPGSGSVRIRTFPVRLDSGRVWIGVPEETVGEG